MPSEQKFLLRLPLTQVQHYQKAAMNYSTDTLPGNDHVQYTPVLDYHDPNEKPKKLPVNKNEVEPSLMKDAQTWNGFTQSTTIHGVKYIFEKGSKLRR